MKKILFLIESFSGGGAEKVLSVLVKYLNHEDFYITVCSVVDIGIYRDEIKKYVNYVTILGSPKSNSMIYKLLYKVKYKLIYNILPIKWVYKFFLPHDNDVEIAFVEGYATKLLSYSNNKKAKKIAWIHTDLLLNPWTIRQGFFKSDSDEKKCYECYDVLVSVSENVRTNFLKKYGLADRIMTIYNPVDDNQIRIAAHEEYVLKNKSSFTFVSVGRLVKEKGYDVLVEAASKLKERKLRFKLIIIGEGPEVNFLSKKISDLDLEENVELMNFQLNPYKIIRNADCFISSSRVEGFSLVILEAMILSKPIISTNTSGAMEILNGGEYGCIVKCTVDDLAFEMQQFVENPIYIKEYSQKAQKRSTAFSLNQSINKISNLFT